MYDLRIIHELCERIAAERDPKKIKKICDVLRTVILEKDAETALRLKLLQNKYKRIQRDSLSDSGPVRDLPKIDLTAVRPIRGKVSERERKR